MISDVDQMHMLIVNNRVRVIACGDFLQQLVGVQIERAHNIVAAGRREAEVVISYDGNSVHSSKSIDRSHGVIRGGVYDAYEAIGCVPRVETRAVNRHVVDERTPDPKWRGDGDNTRRLHRLGSGARG